MDQEYFNENEAAAYIRCSPHSMRMWRREKKHDLTGIHIGRRVVYTKAELDRFVACASAQSNGGNKAA